MKRFILRFLFVVACLCVALYGYSVFCDFLNNTKSEKNTIFIWGDSQTVQGLDLELLSQKTKKQVYSSAQHGGGVYDFLVFAEMLPENATCVVGYSPSCMLREKRSDTNNSGLCLPALWMLYRNNYTLKNIYDIASNNRFVAKSIFYSTSRERLYEYADTIVYSEPLSMFEKSYLILPSYYIDKNEIYKKGVQILKDKKCKIVFVCFPYHQVLYNIEKSSLLSPTLENAMLEIVDEYANSQVDTIFVSNDKTLMYDLTHMNVVGAERVTAALADQVDWNAKNNQFFLVNGRVCH